MISQLDAQKVTETARKASSNDSSRKSDAKTERQAGRTVARRRGDGDEREQIGRAGSSSQGTDIGSSTLETTRKPQPQSSANTKSTTFSRSTAIHMNSRSEGSPVDPAIVREQLGGPRLAAAGFTSASKGTKRLPSANTGSVPAPLLAVPHADNQSGTGSSLATALPKKGLCLLSLDGGGVRGLSSLHILKQLMEVINPDQPPKPCDYFDMIGGTSTGGLMAIMLGRLRMDIDECIDAYVHLFDCVFKKKRHSVTLRGKVQDRFDTKELENAIKEIVFQKCGQQKGSENALLRDGDGRNVRCKVFVCSTRKETAETMQFASFRSSRGSSDLLQKTRIWEAARATSAAPSFFDSIKIGQFGEEFIDGGVGANNPIRALWIEAKHNLLKPGESLEKNLKCLVSIGTGVPSLKPFGGNLLEIAKTLQSIATETEATAESFHRDHSELDEGNQYFRFSVTKGLEKIGLEDAAQTNAIMAATRGYLESQTVKRQMSLCAKNVGEKKCKGTYNVTFQLERIPVVNNFIPRYDEMKKLEGALLPKSTSQSRRQVFVLHGFGGIGKTQLAVEFARNYQTTFSAVFWLNGSTNNQVREDLVRAARRVSDELPEAKLYPSLGTSEDDESIIKRFLQWLSQPDNNRWLLIFRNVDRDSSSDLKKKDPDAFDVTRYFPSADHGSILISSQLSQLRKIGMGLQLSEVNEQQGIDILNSCLDEKREGLERIVRRLGGIPLALNHAGSFLRQTGCTVSDYLDFYERQWEKLVGGDQASSTYNSILPALTLSFEKLEQKNPNAAKLLLLWAHLDRANVWYGLLASPLTKPGKIVPDWFLVCVSDKLAFLKMVKVLVDHSLIEVNVGSQSYSMHPVLHTWCYHLLARKQCEYIWLAAVVLDSALKLVDHERNVGTKRQLLPHCNQLLSQIDSGLTDAIEDVDMLEAFHRLASTFGHLYLIIPHGENAIKAITFAYNGRKKVLGPDNPLTVDVGVQLANLYMHSGKLDQAEEILLRHRKVTTFERRQLDILKHLGDLYIRQKRWKKAEETLEQFLEASKRQPSQGDLYACDALHGLGRLYASRGRRQEAKEMHTQALNWRTKLVGPDDHSTLTSVAELAALYSAVGNPQDAEALYLRAIEGFGKIWGKNHWATLGFESDLGCLYQKTRRYEEAEKLFLRAKLVFTKDFGPSDKNTLIATNHLEEISILRMKS